MYGLWIAAGRNTKVGNTMRTHPRKLSDKLSDRSITVQLRTAENFEDQVALCNGNEQLANDLFNGAFAVKFQAANRAELGEAKEDDLATVIETLQEVASEGWTFDGRGERKPRAPKEVAIADKASYSREELDAILAQVGAKSV